LEAIGGGGNQLTGAECMEIPIDTYYIEKEIR